MRDSMKIQKITIDEPALRKLLGMANGDAALLYLYIKNGGEAGKAMEALSYSQSRYACALATLHQLGLHQDEKQTRLPGEQPQYTEVDVLGAMDTDVDFRALYGEIQRLLGKNLNTEELKILLGFVRYLGMPEDVICVLVSYCQDRARQRGSLRNPSLRTIEKEAYAWAERGIDSMEDAIMAPLPDESTEGCDLGTGPDIYAEVLKLPQNMREVILLFYYEELSIREISQILQTSEVNVKKRLSRARQKLKLELADDDAE